MNTPPQTIEELQQRVYQLAGLTVTELADQLAVSMPSNLQREKGIVGQLLELALGASAGSKAEPDFPQLHVELKTIPIDQQGRPLESTFVCVAPMTGFDVQTYEQSWVCRKLQRVLWMPILANRDLPLAERVIGRGFFWSPSIEQHQILKQDWEELMELLRFGQLQKIKGQHGVALQLRPKAANSRIRTEALGEDGETIQALPRGFYLKTSFTAAILRQAFN